MNKTNKYLLNKYGTEILPSNLWRAHIDDNVPISNDFYGADGRAEDDLADNMDLYSNKDRDGSELSAEKDKEKDEQLEGDEPQEEDISDKEIDKIKERRTKHKKKKQNALSPHPFYSSMYSSLTGVEGLYSSPLEYYSGSIADGDGAQNINPYQGTYQTANDVSIKIKIRTDILKDFCKFAYNTPIMDQDTASKEAMYSFNPITECLKSLEEAKTIARELERDGHEEIVILHGKTKHKWHHHKDPNYREEVRHWYQVGQI